MLGGGDGREGKVIIGIISTNRGGEGKGREGREGEGRT